MVVYGLAVAVAAALAAGSWAVLQYSSRVHDVYRLGQLEKENQHLTGELGNMSGELESLRRDVTQNFDFQKKARLLANLDELPEDVMQVGIGGPDRPYLESLSDIGPKTREKVVSVRADLEKLMRQAELQRKSYEEILSSLEATSDRLRSTPSLRPVDVGFITSRFGRRIDPFTGRLARHQGVDFSARKGTPVYATADGVITFSGSWKTYGQVVEISHGYGYVTRYAHLEKRLVHKGDKVRRGDVIGRVGSTGRSTFAHLHYEVEKDGTRVNPLRYVLAGR